MHSFLWAQPDLNWGNPEVVEAMKKVMRFWFDRGLDGFRLDSANYIWKQKHFMDEPENPNFVDGKMEKYLSLSHIYTKDQDEVFPILEELSRVSHEYGKNKYLIVEAYPNVWGRDAIVSYQKYYERLDSNIIAPFNFEFIFLPWDAEEYRAFIDAYLLVMADRHQPLFVLGNHDRPRIASRLGEDQARVAAMLILTLPGIPIIYNGEELGMTNVGIPSDRVQDPFAKRDPLFGRDPFRTPMQWEGSKNAGFSKGDPWLPIGDNYKTLNAEIESNDKMSVLNLYRNLLDLRKKSEAINKGEYKSLMLENQNVYGFMRHFGDEKILILLNFSHEAQKVDLDFDWGTLLYSTRLDHETCIECDDMKSVLLRPNEGCIYSL